MTYNETPILDPRDAEQVFDALLARRPAYLSDRELLPVEGDTSWALLRIFARYMQVVIDRLNQAPDKNLLAFLDMLGLSLIPARAARAPVVFRPMPRAADGRIAAGTRLGAEVPSRDEPLTFQTEHAIAMAAAQLVQVRTLWPARDVYADHTMAFAGGRPFTLFEQQQPVPHVLFLAHDTLFDFAGKATIEIEFELATPGSEPLALAWEHWDGQVWRPFREFDLGDRKAIQDGTDGLTRSGVVTLRAECGPSEKTTINGIEAYWIRGRLERPLPPDPARVLSTVDRIRLRTIIERPLQRHDGSGAKCVGPIQPDQAFAGGGQLDLSGTFFPFGRAPDADSMFYFASEEVFSKPGARVHLCFRKAETPEEEADQEVRENGSGVGTLPPPRLIWEHWNGRSWEGLLGPVGDDATNFQGSSAFDDPITFPVPTSLEPTNVNEVEARWLRVRLASGSYSRLRVVSWTDTSSDNTNIFPIIEPRPPALKDFFLGYTYRSPWERPTHCVTYNDFQFDVHSHDVRQPGGFFPPFRPVTDATPALYLGFDRPLPNDLISLYLDLQEQETVPPLLVWEAWDGTTWRELAVTDETDHLRRPGMVSFIAPDVAPRPETTIKQADGTHVVTPNALEAAVFEPGQRVVLHENDTREMATVERLEDAVIHLQTPLTETYTGGVVSLAALPRFGTPRDWIRARLQEVGAPSENKINGIYLNAAWAVQVQTLNSEVFGSGTGQPTQTFFFRRTPVLPGEQIEVRELQGARAEVELPILREELRQRGFTEDDIRLVVDARTQDVTEVWVRWRPRPHLFFSGPDDRHYVIDRARGRLIVGDNHHGKIPPAGANNIRARRYDVTEGVRGNVPEETITQLLSAAPLVQAVTNPHAADGGANGESLQAVKTRGPQRLRHRGHALAARDYEALAREASPGVAAARVLPTTAPNGRPAPGWVTVIIVPQSQAPQPQPSFELRQQVHDYLATRAPATVAADRIAVIGPTYLPIGVAATITPRAADEAGVVEARVRSALLSFLHPLTGGPDGQGWSFGRDVYLSDVAAIVESVSGVDYAATLNLLINDTPRGEQVPVPPDRIVVAGPIRIEMKITRP